MIPIFDGHNDTLLALYQRERGEDVGFFDRSEQGHLDFERAKAGGLAGGFFAIFSPTEQFDLKAHVKETENGYDFPLTPSRDRHGALQDTLAMAAALFRIEADSGGRFKVVRTVSELRHCLENDIMAAIFHIEGAEAIDPQLATLELLYQAGLRSLGPVWSRQNAFGTGVPFSFPKHPDTGDGLTVAGKELVKACNRLGILIDLSHLNEKGFWDVVALSDAPLVATHSNAHALSASPRNLLDNQLEAIRESDGMVGLNFAVQFLREDGKKDARTPLKQMVRHLDYLIDKLGDTRVGFGSDFDGAEIPEALGDVSGLPKLMNALKEHGYDEATLKKLAHENWLRVLELSWRGG